MAAASGNKPVRSRASARASVASGAVRWLTGISLSAAGSLDPEVLLSRALKLPGDREEQLIGALGELLAYLEFEIKNHPAIDEPDELLAGLEPLRRRASGY